MVFQFYKVRLKLEAQAGRAGGRAFQFYKVRLKQVVRQPYHQLDKISILQSSIKTPLEVVVYGQPLLFQFYKVRLKPPPLASLSRFWLFQFYKVRLKLSALVCNCSIPQFQFYKVRLKHFKALYSFFFTTFQFYKVRLKLITKRSAGYSF